MILESVEHGPLIWPTVEETGVTITKKYVELSAAEKIQADYDMKVTNIILQGLPADIYSLVNHHRVAKDLWERVQLLMQDPGVLDGQAVQTIILNNAALQTEDLDTYDSDCDDVSNVKAVLIANISNYGSDVISELPTNNNQRSSLIPRNSQNAQPSMNTSQDIKMQMVDDNVGNHVRHNAVQFDGNKVGQNTVQNLAPAEGNGNVKLKKRDAAYLQQQLQITQEEEAWIQSTQEEFKFMATADAYEETERVKANYILENNLQQASTSSTQSDNAPVYYSDRSAENDSNVISEVSSVKQDGGTVEQHFAYVEETRAYHESLFHNLAAKVKKVNSVNQKMKETNAELTTELARYKDQEKCFETSQEKYDKLERCYQKSVYQEECLTKKINALHLSSDKQITTLNEEISNLNKQLSKEKSTVSSLQEERKEAAKFVRDIKSLSKKADESLTKHKALEIERLLRAIISQDIMSVVQNNSVVDSSNLQTELERHHSWNEYIPKQSILEKPPTSSRPKLYVVTPLPKSKAIPKIDESRTLSKPVTSNLVPTLTKSKVMKNDNVISLGIFRINPFKASRVDNFVPNKHVKPNVRTKPINVSQPHVITKNDANSKTNGLSTKDVKSTIRNRRPFPRNNPKNDKQCLITFNHDVRVLNYVNGMNSHGKKQKANVSNQKKHKAQVWKPKNVGSKERLASPEPSTPRTFLSKRFPNSTFSMTGGQNWFATLLIPLLSEYKPKDKEDHGDNEFVSKSTTVTTADASDKRQQQQDSTSSTSTQETTITADGNFDL
uniref:Integrase, catalytic region, zinc finger, CCHC-type, peptidase aspartic, catalytic n=1 Tax=Tanacetum cinerariifolium TaxID=118510 RepID=A0A6L2MAI0_TANCI|nr:hypothetical protein [Tanacetum cinerariifolium]